MKPLDARILDIYDGLTPLERRLADVILEHQRELASYSATELSLQADVSKATAARLFKRLGYSSYNDARQQSRALRRWGSPLSLLEGLEELDGSQPSIVTHLQNDIANLTRTFGALRPEAIGQVVDMLVRADRIWVIGFRASHELAELAAFWLKHLQYSVSLLPSGWMTFAEDVIDMRAGDAVLAIGFRRRPRMFRALLQNARDVGANVILVTDLSASGAARLAHVVLRCHSRPSGVFDSYVAATSLLNYVLAALALREGAAVRARLQHIENLHDKLDAFTLPARSR
jgi:DNA-binding MurR/RpiR family transcriptional regulator